MGLKSLRNFGFSLVCGAAFFAASAMAPSALAALTLNGSIGGVSAQDLTDPAKPIIYGGFAGGCTSDGGNNTSTCDSCAVAPTSGMTVCNLTNAYDALIVAVPLSTTTTGYVQSNFKVTGNSKEQTTFANPPQVDGSGTVIAYMTWGEICALLGSSGTSCSANISGEMTLTLKNTTNEDSITIAVRSRVETAGPKPYEDCNDVNTTLSEDWGVCHFEAVRGDEKIFAKNVVYTEGYPTTSAVSGIPYDGVVFFYEENTDGTDQNTLIGRISSRSKTKVIQVNPSRSLLADDRVTGLQNEVEYCMLMGNRDKSGIISGFTPAPSTGQTTATQLCQTPSLVVGLLDDKKCFIATAAFGSTMAPEVESFREFRNHFLLTNPVGKSFVRFYYKHSPYFANLIAQSEVTKAVVRAALWPMLVFARVALVFGFWMTLLFTAVGGLGIYEIYRRFFLGHRFRGEL